MISNSEIFIKYKKIQKWNGICVISTLIIENS